MSMVPITVPYGRWQPLGCQWHNKRPLVGGMPHLCYMGFVCRTFFPLPLTPGIPDHPKGEDPGFSQGVAGMCRGVWDPARHPMCSHQGAPTMHDPVDGHQWG